MNILNFGSLNIDFVYSLDHFVQRGETITSRDLQIFSGGKGLNQSVALGRAGISVYHAGAIGEDGQFLLEVLKGAGVHTETVRIVHKERTGNAIIQKEPSGDNCIILYSGANRTITRQHIDETFALFSPGDFLLLQNEINDIAYIAEEAHKKGMTIFFNPSPMDENIFTVPLECIDYFILNEIEARQLLDCQDNSMENLPGKILAARLLDRFPYAHFVLTLGKEGAIYIDKDGSIEQAIYEVPVVDTTAAGDTFTGFFIASLTQGLSVKQALDRATKASAITVSRMGAAPSIPTAEEVDNFILSS